MLFSVQPWPGYEAVMEAAGTASPCGTEGTEPDS